MPEPTYTEPEPVPEPTYTEPEPAPEPTYTEPEPTYTKPEPVPEPEPTLEITIVKEGPGPVIQPGDKVHAFYRGTLVPSGKQFDTNIGGKPFTFVAGASEEDRTVIPAWNDGFVGLRVGDQAIIVAPPKYGYGNRNIGNGLIPPNSTLKFEIMIIGANGKALERPKPKPEPVESYEEPVQHPEPEPVPEPPVETEPVQEVYHEGEDPYVTYHTEPAH